MKNFHSYKNCRNNLSKSDDIDPWKDGVTALGLIETSPNISNETEYEEINEGENSTKAKSIEMSSKIAKEKSQNEMGLSKNVYQKVANESPEQQNSNAGLRIRIHIKPQEVIHLIILEIRILK